MRDYRWGTGQSTIYNLAFCSLLFNLLLAACSGLTPYTWDAKALNASRVRQLEQEREIQRLILQLVSHDSTQRRHAFDQLVRYGKQAQPQLLSTARIGEEKLQVEAVKVLAAMSDATLLDSLIEVGRHAYSPETRAEVVHALALLKSKAATPALIYFMEKEESDYVKEKIASAMGELRDTRSVDILLKTYTTHPSYYVRESVLQALGAIGDERAVEPLILQWKSFSKYGSFPEKEQMAAALGKIKSKAPVPLLIYELRNSPASSVRVACARALGEIADKRAVDMLIEALMDDSFDVFSTAQKVLVTITGESFYTEGATPQRTKIKTYRQWIKWAGKRAK